MSLITSQGWDGVTAPSASIAGWTVDSGWATTTTRSASSPPNSIAAAPSNGYRFLTGNTQDPNGGNVQASVSFYFENSFAFGGMAFGLAVRGSASPLNATSTTFYAAEVTADDSYSGAWTITLYKVASGTWTPLASAGPIASSSVAAAWFRLNLTANGTALSAALTRVSDGYSLNPSGAFVASSVNCLAASDSSIGGAGYSAVYAHGTGFNSNPVYADDYLLETYGGVPATGTASTLTAAGALAAAANASGSTVPAGKLAGAGAIPSAALRFDMSSAAPALAAAVLLAPAAAGAGNSANAAPVAGAANLPAATAVLGWAAGASPIIAGGSLAAAGLAASWVALASPAAASATLAPPSVGLGTTANAGPPPGGSGVLAIPTTLLGTGANTVAGAVQSGLGTVPGPSLLLGFSGAAGSLAVTADLGAVSLQLQGAQFVAAASLPASGRWPSPATWMGGNGIVYNVYRNDGAGGPVDYSSPVAVTTGTSWTSGPLAFPAGWKFGVRAFRVEDGLEEKNLDAAVALILDSSGADASGRPAPPTGLRAIPRAAGAIRVEWGYHQMDRGRLPAGFRIYAGVGGIPDYSLPQAAVAHVLGRTSYLADLTGLVPGTAYSIGVRAFNAAGEETNAELVRAMSDATGPQGVDTLTAMPTATQGD